MLDNESKAKGPISWANYLQKLSARAAPLMADALAELSTRRIDFELPLTGHSASLRSFTGFPAEPIGWVRIILSTDKGPLRLFTDVDAVFSLLSRAGIGSEVGEFEPGTLALVLEHVLTAEMDRLDQLLGIPSSVTAVETCGGPSVHDLAFDLALDDQAPISVLIEGEAALIDTIATAIADACPEIERPPEDNLMVPIAIRSERLWIEITELNTLLPGDALLLDMRFDPKIATRLIVDDRFWFDLTATESGFATACDPRAIDDDPIAEGLSIANSTNISVLFEVGTMTLGNLRTIKPNTPLQFAPRSTGPAVLERDNKPFAFGRLEPLPGEIALIIQEIL